MVDIDNQSSSKEEIEIGRVGWHGSHALHDESRNRRDEIE